MKRIFILFFNLFGFAGLCAQQAIEVSQMSFTYTIEQDSLHGTLKAPTKGWVGVGFNSKNDIVGSDLLLFRVVSGKVEGLDMYVKSFGNPLQDSENGGRNSVKLKEGSESEKSTQISFSIPLNSKDPNDFVHIPGQKSWLILAYSVEDDFGHHSRVRKHLPFKLGR